MTTKVKDPFMTSMAFAPCSGISTDDTAAAVEINRKPKSGLEQRERGRKERIEPRQRRRNQIIDLGDGLEGYGFILVVVSKTSRIRVFLYRKQVEYVFYNIKK